jgi:hypothetical protein
MAELMGRNALVVKINSISEFIQSAANRCTHANDLSLRPKLEFLNNALYKFNKFDIANFDKLWLNAVFA